MNDLKNLTSRIDKDAADYRERELAQAAQKTEEIRKKYLSQVNDVKAEYEAKMKTAYESSMTGAEAAIAMQGRNMMLQTKNDLIKEVFRRAKEKIIKLGTEQKAELYAEFAKQALSSDKGGKLLICKCDEAGKDIILEKVNQAAKASGVPELELAEKRLSADCGIVISYGEIEYNCMLDTVMESLNCELTSAAVRILFS